MIETRNFAGGLDLDSSLYDVARGYYIDALNITKNDVGANKDYDATNVVGNRIVPYTLPAGVNLTIGAKADVVRNRVFEFIWNSADYHSIVIYDNNTRVRTKLIENLTDSSAVDVLQFTQFNKIIHVDIIYRDDEEGDLLFWTDGNVSPRKCNVKHIQDGNYTSLKVPFIELAKMPPVSPILATYGTDATRNSNSLRKKLLMATYWWKYDDYEISTPTTYSKIPLPIGYYGSDNDIDSTKNNFVTFTVETGDENVTDIEIAVRFNIGNTWSDYVLAVSLNKAQLSIPDNSIFNYLFYNDGIYPPVNIEYAIQLFDWVPKKAKSQCAGNGNTIELAAITEGYDQYPISQLDVTITAANQTNIPPDTDPAAITYTQTFTGSAVDVIFTIAGIINTGTVYTIYAVIGGMFPPIQLSTYTSLPGDDNLAVRLGLYNSTSVLYQFSFNPYYRVELPVNSYILYVNVTPGTSGTDISTEKTWLWKANYVFGIAYKDEQGRLMPGVTTYINPVDSNKDFLVTTPPFSLSGTDVQTPVITAEINHLPPTGAVTFAWVRRRLTYDNPLFYVTCDFKDDPDGDGYLFFCLANIDYYKTKNTQFIYDTAPILPESRLQVIAGATAGAYNGDLWQEDYEIIGTVTKTLTGGTSPDDDKLFIKVKKPIAAISPAYTANMVVMIYTPLLNPTDIADSVFWEWGEEYDIYNDGGNNHHRGMTQDQTGAQPAIFVWAEGDVYFHQRSMYESLITPTLSTLNIMDSNWSDFFNSAVNDNGRGLAIEVNARETYFPATIRFGLEYQQNTSINLTNRFKYSNFIDLDRSFGDIFKMSVKDRYIRIGQRFKIGIVPIFNQISKDNANSTLVASTDVLLNPVQYYAGDHGVGNAPEAWVDFNNSSYFFNTNRGIWCRLSLDGIIPISELYKINSWATSYGTIYNNCNAKILGVYDSKSNNCIFAFEQVDNSNNELLKPFVVSVALNDNMYFYGAVPFNVTVSLILSATNGDAQAVSYVTSNSETTITLRNALIALINNATMTLFHGITLFGTTPIVGVNGVPDGVTIYGLKVSNLAGFGVTSSISVVYQNAATIGFDEPSNSFQSFLSYHPEMMVALGSLLITFKDGQLYTHDSDIYNRFYGIDYPSTIKAVFNQNPIIKKSFVALTEGANTIWECPAIETQVMSYGSTPQQSNLVESDFEDVEGQYNTSLKRDINSVEGIENGDELIGKYVIIKFYKTTASSLVSLSYAELKSIESPLNSK